MAKNRSDYAWRASEVAVYIVDLNLGGRSVTNDAEEVCADFVRRGLLPGRRLVYRDSMKSWSVLHTKADGSFDRFGPLEAWLQDECDRYYSETHEKWSRS